MLFRRVSRKGRDRPAHQQTPASLDQPTHLGLAMLASTGPVARPENIICDFPEAGALCMCINGKQGEVLAHEPARIGAIAPPAE